MDASDWRPTTDPNGEWRALYREIQSSAIFDPDWYISTYPDVRATGLHALEHYVKYGSQLGRPPNEKLSSEKISGWTPAEVFSRIKCQAAGRREHAKKVSILCITYNQERFVAQMIESLLSQETDFAFEVLIGDDNSTDKTAEIIRDYAARDQRVVPILRTSNIGANSNFEDLARRVSGEYVAICEGDDYWTDPKKLQLQVAFLDSKPEYSVCFHPVKIVYDGIVGEESVFPEIQRDEVPFKKLLDGNCIQTNSVMYRWRYGPDNIFKLGNKIAPGDWYIHILHARVGRVGFIDRVMAVYRKNDGGMWASHRSEIDRHKKLGNGELEFFRQLILESDDDEVQELVRRQKELFFLLFELFIEEGDFAALSTLLVENTDIAPACLTEMGLNIDRSYFATPAELLEEFQSQTKVSVIVTCYNHEQYIARCIRSVLAQKGFFTLQILVADDRSTDGTGSRIAELANEFEGRLTLLPRLQNLGMLKNMQDCINNADGTYLAFCEGDDYWLSEHKIAKQLRIMRQHRDIDLCFNWSLLDIEATNSLIPHSEQSSLPERIDFLRLARSPITANFSSCFYRMSAVREIPASYYERTSAADWLFNLYVAEAGGLYFLKELLSVYTIQERGQWSGQSEEKKRLEIQKYQQEFHAIFPHRVESAVPHIRQVGFAPALPDQHVIAWLEQPFDIRFHQPGMWKLQLTGWCVAVLPLELVVVAECDGRFSSVEVDQMRADVSLALVGPSLSGKMMPCGFQMNINVEYGSVVDVSLILGGVVCKWGTIYVDAADRR